MVVWAAGEKWLRAPYRNGLLERSGAGLDNREPTVSMVGRYF